MFHKLNRIKTLPGCMLWAEFKDGREVVYDVSALTEVNPVFCDLVQDSELFAQARIDPGGYGISWNDEIDLEAEELWEHGNELKSAFELAPGCTCPVCGQKLRRHSEAQAAASRANLAKRTHKGGRPIDPNSKRQKRIAERTRRQNNNIEAKP